MREGRSRATHLVALAMIPVGLVIVFAGSTYTPLFGARAVRVDGVRVLEEAHVLELAGIDDGTNVFHLSEGEAEASIAADPWVRSVRVTTSLPDTITVTVEERLPVARIRDGDATVLVTDDGQVIGGRAPGMAALPVVRASLGDLDGAQVGAAGVVLASLDPVVVARVDEVVVGRDNGVTLVLAGGVPVRMGGPGEETAKAAALRAVLRWAAGEGVSIEEIDVSVPGAPSATLEDGQTFTP